MRPPPTHSSFNSSSSLLTNAGQRRWLVLIAAAWLVVAGLAVLWSISGIDPVTSTDRSPQPAGDSPDADQSLDLELTTFAATMSGVDQIGLSPSFPRLRRPLHDPPAAPPVVAKPVPPPVTPPTPKPALQLVLVGTVIDADRRLAILADSSGKVDIKGIGESLELEPAGIWVREIDAERVSVEFHGTRSDVTLDRSIAPSGERPLAAPRPGSARPPSGRPPASDRGSRR